MRICLDARTAGQRMHGIARYNVNLLQAMEKLESPHALYVIVQDPSYLPFGENKRSSVCYIPLKVPPYSVLEQVAVPLVLARIKPDVYHCLTYACPVLAPSHVFFTLHDLLPLACPKEFPSRVRLYYRTFVRMASVRASKIIVDSFHTASMCSRFLGTPKEKISVVPLGGDHFQYVAPSAHVSGNFQALGLHRSPYFLCVANPRPHKRVLFLVKAFLSERALKSENIRLVLVGDQQKEVYDWIARYDHDSQITSIGYVSDALLVTLYTQAAALICPSVEEGFGLPVLEAMHFGLPIVATEGGGVIRASGRGGHPITQG